MLSEVISVGAVCKLVSCAEREGGTRPSPPRQRGEEPKEAVASYRVFLGGELPVSSLSRELTSLVGAVQYTSLGNFFYLAFGSRDEWQRN